MTFMMNSTKLPNGDLYMYMYFILITFQVQYHWSCLVGLSIILFIFFIVNSCAWTGDFSLEKLFKKQMIIIYCAIIFLPILAFWFIQFYSQLFAYFLSLDEQWTQPFSWVLLSCQKARDAIAWKKVLDCMSAAIYHFIDCTLYQMYIATFFQINGQHQLVMTNKPGDKSQLAKVKL